MEARQTLRGSAVSKGLLVVIAMCAAVLLAIGASFIKDLGGSGASFNGAVHPAPGTVLRQDYQGPLSQPLLDRGAERQGGTTVAIGHRAIDSKLRYPA